MVVYLTKAVSRPENRLRANFPSAIHVIENLNVSEHTISAHIRVYADLVALKTDYNQPDHMSKTILDKHVSFPRKEVQSFISENPELEIPETEDPFSLMKAHAAHYMSGMEEDYKSAPVKFEKIEE